VNIGRRFALLPLALLTVGLVAFQAGPALAVKTLEMDISIDCPPTTANVGDTLTWIVTVGNAKSAVQNLQVFDDLSATDNPTDEPDPFNQPDPPYQATFTYKVVAADAGTTISNTGHATGVEEGVDSALDSNTCNTMIAAAATTTTPTTPKTGFSPLPYAAGAILLLMIGAWVMRESRRRTT
jgi:hypothetical protein